MNLTKGSSGEISSPGFPGDYGANTDCLWLLGAQNDAKIKLRYFHSNVGVLTTIVSYYIANKFKFDRIKMFIVSL